MDTEFLTPFAKVWISLYNAENLSYSKKIAKEKNISEMTVASRLRELEDDGFLEKQTIGNTITVRLNQKGRKEYENTIKKLYEELDYDKVSQDFAKGTKAKVPEIAQKNIIMTKTHKID